MNIQVIEIDGVLMCQKFNHNLPIIIVTMESQLPISERLLCTKCLKLNRMVAKMLAIEQVIEMITEKKNQYEEDNRQQRQRNLSIIQGFQQRMNQIQTQILEQFEKLTRITQQWIDEYQKKDDNKLFGNLIEGLEILNQDNQIQEQNNKWIRQINKYYFIKLSTKMKKILAIMDLQSTFGNLKSLEFEKGQQKIKQSQRKLVKLTNQNELNQKLKIKGVNLINFIKQEEWGGVMAFNHNRSTFVAACHNDIKVWSFQNGLLREKKRLTGHSGLIYSIVFSKKLTWFASGSTDCTIRSWKEDANGEWFCCQPEQLHTSYVRCLLLTNDEDELISCSSDQTILVWKVNTLRNQLNFNYALEHRHTHFIYCLCLNLEETFLASCSHDQRIILWNKDKQKKWRYQNEIVNDDHGKRLCFISPDQILWQQFSKGITHFFEVKNGILVKFPELNIELNQETQDHGLFPTIFNRKKQIIVQSHNRFIYLLKKQENNLLALVTAPIDCVDLYNYGQLTDDGEYLLIWNQGTKEIRVYQIKYK